MIRTYPITLILILLISCPCAILAQDTTFNRVVTVERDYQPEIQEAQAITTTPAFLQFTPQLNPVVYSTYSSPLSIGYNLHALAAAETQFRTPNPLNGILGGALGHRNTHFLFGYNIKHKKKMSLDTYAKHNAYWGRNALSQSQLGIRITRHFLDADLYFSIEGNNDAYTNFGDWRNIWQTKTKIGLMSTGSEPIQYHVQTGYQAFIATGYAVEHQICSHLNISWSNDTHKAGLNAYIQNNLYTTTDTTFKNIISARHAMRIEPFYEFNNQNIRLHAGVNVNLNLGIGKLLSTTDKISFAPSPNIKFEWNMMDNIFQLYTHATGSFGIGSLEEYLGYNRYLDIKQGLTINQPRTYSPIDLQLGFKIHPIKPLLIDIYGGYVYTQNACYMQATLTSTQINQKEPNIDSYQLIDTIDYQRWKLGISLHYHYRDIIEVNATGNYYFWNVKKGLPVYDRPDWDIYARIDANINSKWSIYSENYFAGAALANTSNGDKNLKSTISLNIGGQYTVNRWLVAYLQINDYINRKNDIFYGYKTQGIHFLLGVKYKF